MWVVHGLKFCKLQVKRWLRTCLTYWHSISALLPVLLSTRILPGSAHNRDDPPHSHWSGSTLSGLHWQPQRKGNSNQHPLWSRTQKSLMDPCPLNNTARGSGRLSILPECANNQLLATTIYWICVSVAALSCAYNWSTWCLTALSLHRLHSPTQTVSPLSSGARAGSLLAPVFHVPAAGAAVLPDRRRNYHPASRESRPLPLPPLPARPDPGLLPGAQDHDPKAHHALPSAAVWQGGQLTPRGDEPRLRAALPPQRAARTTRQWYVPLNEKDIFN